MEKACVVAIFTAHAAGEPMVSRDQVHAVPGRGLEGDRYFKSVEASSDPASSSLELTLIEVEAIEALESDYGIKISPGDARRNIVTRGVSLNTLVGREFKVGQVSLRGHSLCEPCSSLAKAIGQPHIVKALVHRAGLRAQILSDGVMRVGDPVQA